MIDAERKVKTALLAYRLSKGRDCNAGWNVLRYAKQGYISINKADFAVDFMEWYPNDPDFLILSLAKAGKLNYAGLANRANQKNFSQRAKTC